MRLICPKCQAKYEIDGTLIPVKGRQVQCSACGNTWFQKREDDAAAVPEKVDGPRPVVVPDAPPAPPAPAGPSEAGAEDAPAAETANGEAAEAPAGMTPPRRPIDPNVLSVLRDEAARESEARRPRRDAGTGGEAQTHRSPGDDLGLSRLHPNPVRTNAAAASREPKDELRSAAQKTTRPTTLRPEEGPDPEAVNKRLRGIVERETKARIAAVTDRRRRRRRAGFWTGFTFAALVSGAAVAAYVAAPEIAQQMPEAEAALEDYLTLVNQARDEVGTAVDRLLARADRMLAN